MIQLVMEYPLGNTAAHDEQDAAIEEGPTHIP